MRQTLQVAREGVTDAGRQVQIAAEDTRDILTELLVPIAIIGLVLPLPFGWIGDLLGFGVNALNNNWYQWAWMYRVGTFLFHLGNLPAQIAFVVYGYYFWMGELRTMTADGAVQVLPESVREGIAKWSTKEGFMGKLFWVVSMFGLWSPVILMVPAEFPVWRYPFHYLGAIVVTMSVTQFVATIKVWDIKFWRYLLGTWVLLMAARHMLGLMGVEVGFESLTRVSIDGIQDWVMEHFILTLIVLGAITLLWPSSWSFGKPATTTGGGHA